MPLPGEARAIISTSACELIADSRSGSTAASPSARHPDLGGTERRQRAAGKSHLYAAGYGLMNEWAAELMTGEVASRKGARLRDQKDPGTRKSKLEICCPP